MTKRTVIEIGSNHQMTLIEDNGAAIMNPTPTPHSDIKTEDWQVLFTVDGALRIRWKDQETRLSTFNRSGLLVLHTPESQANANVGANKSLVFSDGAAVRRRSLIRAVFLSSDEEGNEEVVSQNYVA